MAGREKGRILENYLQVALFSWHSNAKLIIAHGMAMFHIQDIPPSCDWVPGICWGC